MIDLYVSTVYQIIQPAKLTLHTTYVSHGNLFEMTPRQTKNKDKKTLNTSEKTASESQSSHDETVAFTTARMSRSQITYSRPPETSKALGLYTRKGRADY